MELPQVGTIYHYVTKGGDARTRQIVECDPNRHTRTYIRVVFDIRNIPENGYPARQALTLASWRRWERLSSITKIEEPSGDGVTV